MSALGSQVNAALGQALVAVVPLLLAALVGGALAGWLGVRVGLRDPVAAAVLRGLVVLGALALLADGLGERARIVTAEAWSQLATVGRAER